MFPGYTSGLIKLPIVTKTIKLNQYIIINLASLAKFPPPVSFLDLKI